MPNKYEREIEEILRNLERTEPKAGLGQRVSGRLRRKATARRSMPSLHLTFSEWCLVIAVIAALGAGGWEYAQGGGTLATGIIALVGAVCVVLVALSPFIIRQRYSSGPYSNVTPLRSKTRGRFGTRWHLLMLKLRYRKRRTKE